MWIAASFFFHLLFFRATADAAKVVGAAAPRDGAKVVGAAAPRSAEAEGGAEAGAKASTGINKERGRR